MAVISLEKEKIKTKETLALSHEPAPINLHLYQPPRLLRIQYKNRQDTIFDITGRSDSSEGFNEQITAESYKPLITEGILANKNVSWNLYGVTADWMEVCHPELICALQNQIADGATPPVGDTYLHIIYPFLSRDHKDMLMQISKRVYKERWGAEMETVWLPESAVDSDTISSLISAGIKGVHLREHQLQTNNQGNIFRVDQKNGSILTIVGNNHLSGIIGFDKPWADAFFNKLHQTNIHHGFAPRLSIDGETLGHWWKKDEGAFAFTKYLLRYLDGGLDGKNLDYSIPRDIPEANVVENTSWSCLDHGVGRWQGSDNCYCGLPGNRDEAQKVRASKKDLYAKLIVASERIDQSLDSYLPGWRELYIEWFLTQRNNLAVGESIKATMFKDSTLEKLFLSAYIRDLGWTSCGWFFGDVNGFERQIPANSLKAISQICNWPDLAPQKI